MVEYLSAYPTPLLAKESAQEEKGHGPHHRRGEVWRTRLRNWDRFGARTGGGLGIGGGGVRAKVNPVFRSRRTESAGAVVLA